MAYQCPFLTIHLIINETFLKSHQNHWDTNSHCTSNQNVTFQCLKLIWFSLKVMMRLQDSLNSTKSWTHHTSAIFAHNNKTPEQIHPNPASMGALYKPIY